MSTSVSESPSIQKWIVVAATVLTLLVGVFVIRSQGRISGEEFSPTHFQTRDFRFYEIPLLHLQITPIRRSLSTGEVATYLRQKSLISAPPGPAKIWHLVRFSRGLTGDTPADASFLTDPLQMAFDGDYHWRQWSIDHPQHAVILWPQVQKLATRELYLLIPGLLELVASLPDSSRDEIDSGKIQALVDAHLQREYAGLILDMAAADRPRLAAELLAEARADYPGNQSLSRINLP